ncbi:DUF1697 domain-containing protein [Microbacterium sp. CFBP9034]|uniref:DUF1697 domain-containing protein n=1 Tax=Microbacterium sp. CFBP9034 TaxID=3096540 RepID=UPI002A6A0E38|nr:DUF1697 domain-containing protein [Microbacterium sp. CFBP9034]MDY0908312.1 DUF1697 domain-containing protein [Microbacterium sp. CFBP9034]
MQQVAFLRNVNQGQRGQPSTADIVAAFRAAGAVDVQLFQSNGTVLFAAASPDAVVVDVPQVLASLSGFEAVVFSRPLAFIEQVVARSADAADLGRRELTLFTDEVAITDEVAAAAQAAKRRCTIVEHGAGWAVLTNDADRQSNGTPALEAALGTPASSRGIPTLVRLVDRFSR